MTMTISLSFLTAVALAGIAYLVGHLLVSRIPALERNHVPEPVLGGVLFALAFLLLRQLGVVVEVPTSGRPLDLLVALLTTNMGLHVTPKVLREGWRLFFVFLLSAGVLFLAQFLVALPVALLAEAPIHTGIVVPLSLVGAPFNLNPPSQTAPIQQLFQDSYPNLGEVAQGVMMIGVLLGLFLAGIMGRLLLRRAGTEPPKPPKEAKEVGGNLLELGHEWMRLITLILSLIAVAFLAQDLLLRSFGWFKQDYLPVILLGYLLGGLFRLAFEAAAGAGRFPERLLNVLLLGPTMGTVFAYALMSLPLHYLGQVTLPLAIGVLLGVLCSVLASWLLFPLLARLTNRYYAGVVATAFLAVTTAWGPVGMAHLRFFMREDGGVPPMPVVMPVNAFYLFPWLAIFLTSALLRL